MKQRTQSVYPSSAPSVPWWVRLRCAVFGHAPKQYCETVMHYEAQTLEAKALGASLSGETEGEQLHAVLMVGKERLKIVWRTPLWFQVMAWVRGLDGLVQRKDPRE